MIKEDGWKDPNFLLNRILEQLGKERTKENYQEAKEILNKIVIEDRSLRFIKTHREGVIGRIYPPGTLVPERRITIAYHPYLEPNGVYRGRSRGRPRKR